MTDDPQTPERLPENPEYSDASFWEKLRDYALAAGKQVVEMALQLYYALQSPVTPMWARAIIIAALAYFIMPLDAIPDAIPVVGYTDDLGALAAALAMVGMHITPEIKEMARAKMEEWFGKN